MKIHQHELNDAFFQPIFLIEHIHFKITLIKNIESILHANLDLISFKIEIWK